ncbi:LacI family DNA-binding transcriptional regulator [Actinotalea sp. K2]|uniref:LacI family DNA-binding transcriptional regulator n=1 Tax=Actinotalea sp. K2 TaxID=2939438 RepID=UPI002016F8C6|nr:LacI family DNA-binding transcriptional regulator [Actinotalea sp. K2]MCL3860460.1 LacI family DNA-binding transcriptional regulator [Actinotalea sp. K2]
MATMQDVARRANVSLSTVSYALSGARPVSASTKARIDEAMRELGFRPNALAQGLASRRSRTLALIFPAMDVGISGTVTEFVASAARTAKEHGYHLVLWPFGADQAEEIRDLVHQGMADGVLLMEVRLQDDRVDALHTAGLPFTLIGRTADVDGLTCVDIDFDRTTEDAVAHLVDLGHRHIGFLNHSAASHAARYAPTLRGQQGFREAMVRRGLEPHDVLCHESPGAGREAMAELLAREPRMTAVVTMNEIATFGATVELQDRGLRIPEDFSVLSIVTSPGVGAMSNPPLTTMHAPGAELGRLGVEALVRLVGGGPGGPAPVLISCRLEIGGSTAPARSPDRS